MTVKRFADVGFCIETAGDVASIYDIAVAYNVALAAGKYKHYLVKQHLLGLQFCSSTVMISTLILPLYPS